MGSATLPKRALVFELSELEFIMRALTDFAIDSWGGVMRNPEYATVHEKVQDALRRIDIEEKQKRLHA